MTKQEAEKIIALYVKPVYGFALKRCACIADAEDLSQEIVLRAYRTLLVREDIEDVSKFIWTIAHNALANYYRDSVRRFIGTPIDELSDTLADTDADTAQEVMMRETMDTLSREIAYLSKLQRRIVVAYYYENKKQSEIADELGIPIGTVKWHLFEAKKDLKKGMENMRQYGELKFNPIKFAVCGTSGSVGEKGGCGEFFRSILSQNIAYAVLYEAKSVNEIADILGVSPVYVESEAELLYEYGFLTKKNDKYLCNILLDEPTNEIIGMQSDMYEKAAKIFANELYNRLMHSDVLKNSGILSRYRDDRNYLLWSFIPYIAALSGEKLLDTSISFDEAATLRPDGGHNICYASVLSADVKPPKYFDSMKHWFGPCWDANDNITIWGIDSEWSDVRMKDSFHTRADRELSLLSRMKTSALSEDEYAYLAQRGYIHAGDKIEYSCIRINSDDKRELLKIGAEIKNELKAEFDNMKAPFIKAVLDSTPPQLRKMQMFVLQFIFYADGWFLLHCMKELVNSGKLLPVTEEQRRSMTMMVIDN